VTEQTRTYPCSQCGANLVYDPGHDQLLCLSCGHGEVLSTPKGTVSKQDLGEAMRQLSQRIASTQQGPPATLTREVVCQNCGGRTSFDGTLTATRCPFCATPIQRDDLQAAPARLPIDGVLPFGVDEETARANVNKWINGRWFAPREFKTYREVGSFTSIYLTYFAYDAQTVTDYTGQRGENYTVEVGSGDNRRTETRTNWWPVSGQVRNTFQDVIEPANTGLDRKKIVALDPWPIPAAQPYSPQYVAGHLARTYDEDAQQRFDNGAREQLDDEIRETIRRDIGGDEQRVGTVNTTYQMLTFAQVLLPVWLLTVTFEGMPFQVFINGVTGEVQGRRPWSRAKITAAVVAAIIVVAIVVVVVRLFQ
jgi:DNA-directed RNA polymerase subunit RPC12/RpoP